MLIASRYNSIYMSVFPRSFLYTMDQTMLVFLSYSGIFFLFIFHLKSWNPLLKVKICSLVVFC